MVNNPLAGLHTDALLNIQAGGVAVTLECIHVLLSELKVDYRNATDCALCRWVGQPWLLNVQAGNFKSASILRNKTRNKKSQRKGRMKS